MNVTCKKEHTNKNIKVGETSTIIDADLCEYLIMVGYKQI